MDSKLFTLSGTQVSLQVSVIDDIPAGDFELGKIFLIKNNTEDNITVQILPAGQTNYISTTLYPGWNPEIVKGVKGVVDNTLQYGY